MNAKHYLDQIGILTEHGTGFETIEQANEFAALHRAAWGDNLIYLGATEKNGLFFPEFNFFN
jgi:hypothetical protein